MTNKRDALASCTCSNLRKATRAITQLYDLTLDSSGLLITQFTVLGAVATGGSTTITRLAGDLAMDRTTLTRNLKPLVRRGLLSIAAGDDERTRFVTLTNKGRQALLKAFPLWEHAQTRVVKTLGEEHWRSLLSTLSRLTAIARQK